MKLKRTITIAITCLSIGFSIFCGSMESEAAVNPNYCWHERMLVGNSIVGHYEDYHIPCPSCNTRCKRLHEIIRTTYYCPDCYVSYYEDEDRIVSHSICDFSS